MLDHIANVLASEHWQPCLGSVADSAWNTSNKHQSCCRKCQHNRRLSSDRLRLWRTNIELEMPPYWKGKSFTLHFGFYFGFQVCSWPCPQYLMWFLSFPWWSNPVNSYGFGVKSTPQQMHVVYLESDLVINLLSNLHLSSEKSTFISCQCLFQMICSFWKVQAEGYLYPKKLMVS